MTIFLDGTWDMTGALAVTGGVGALLFGCAYILLTDPAIRRIVVLLMVISSVVLLLSSAFGFFRVEDAVTDAPLMPGATGTEFTPRRWPWAWRSPRGRCVRDGGLGPPLVVRRESDERGGRPGGRRHRLSVPHPVARTRAAGSLRPRWSGRRPG